MSSRHRVGRTARSMLWATVFALSSVSPVCSAQAQSLSETFVSSSAETMKSTIDFLVTIALGAFAALGYILKDSKLTSFTARVFQIIFSTCALGLTLASLYFSYHSYLDLVAMTNSGTFAFASLPSHYAWAALMLLLDGAALYLVLVVTTGFKAP
jgi:hypothetical protein